MAQAIDSYGTSHIGLVREENEDNFFVAELRWSLACSFAGDGLAFDQVPSTDCTGLLMAVADGMGGHAAGKRASQLALSSISSFLVNDLNRMRALHSNEHELCDILRRSVFVAHHALMRDCASMPEKSSMGTTLTMALVLWPKAYLVHVGDSRCYLLRDHELKQLTRDHTVRQLRADLVAGTATREQTQMFENVNWLQIKADEALWNVIAANAESVLPELTQIILRGGDSLLLCSDGLVKHMAERQIESIIDEERSSEETCERLVVATNAKGGLDNVTTILARFSKELKDDPHHVHLNQTIEQTSEADTLDFPSISAQLAARANSDTSVDLKPLE